MQAFFFFSFYIRITNFWFVKQIRIAYTRISIHALIERATHIYTQHTHTRARARVPIQIFTYTHKLHTYIHTFNIISSLFVCLFICFSLIDRSVRDLRRNKLFFLISLFVFLVSNFTKLS